MEEIRNEVALLPLRHRIAPEHGTHSGPPGSASSCLDLGMLARAFTWVKALILTVDAVALLEFRERRNLHPLRQAAAAVLPPALCLFAGVYHPRIPHGSRLGPMESRPD